ncbi:MAG: hypothetical protein JXA25_05020 [Anaerolineales bacterium]|nr:hypothetical protein [Anaerolineales bacterium]
MDKEKNPSMAEPEGGGEKINEYTQELQRAEVLQQLADGHIDVDTAVSLLSQKAVPAAQPESSTESVVRMNILERLERGEMEADEALAYFDKEVEYPEPERTGMDILRQIEDGSLSAVEAVNLLKNQQTEEVDTQETPVYAAVEETDEDRELLRSRSRMTLLVIGMLLSALGGWFGSLGGWWWLGAAPLLLIGVPLLVLVVVSWRSTWLFIHVRTDEDWPKKISLCFPLPLKLAGWVIRNFGSSMASLKHSAVDELLMELENSIQRNQPLSIVVDEGDSGERVRVYLG